MATLQLDLLPAALQACKLVGTLHQALVFPGELLWAVERKQSHCSNFIHPSIHPHCPPLSKMRQKTCCSPKHCSAYSLFPPEEKRGCPLALTVTTKEQHSEMKRPVHTEPSLVAFVIFCSGKTSLSGFTKD